MEPVALDQSCRLPDLRVHEDDDLGSTDRLGKFRHELSARNYGTGFGSKRVLQLFSNRQSEAVIPAQGIAVSDD